jgi:hypothetical protein
VSGHVAVGMGLVRTLAHKREVECFSPWQVPVPGTGVVHWKLVTPSNSDDGGRITVIIPELERRSSYGDLMKGFKMGDAGEFAHSASIANVKELFEKYRQQKPRSVVESLDFGCGRECLFELRSLPEVIRKQHFKDEVRELRVNLYRLYPKVFDFADSKLEVALDSGDTKTVEGVKEFIFNDVFPVFRFIAMDSSIVRDYSFEDFDPDDLILMIDDYNGV